MRKTLLPERLFMKKSTFAASAALLVALLATSLAAAGESYPNPLFDAQPGEWAVYSIPGGYTQKQTVISREGAGAEALVKIRIENIYNDAVVTSQEIVEQAGDPTTLLPPPPPGQSMTVVNDSIAIKGVATPVSALLIRDADGDESIWYVSRDIPVHGLVRQEIDGVVEYDLIDFGAN